MLLTCAVLRRSQMIYLVLAVTVLGQAVQNGALLELTGEAAKVKFGGALTLIHNSTENELVCSGKIRASDVIIEGTTTTVADLIGQMATLQGEMEAVKQFVGMMPPPASPPLTPPAMPRPNLPPHRYWHGYWRLRSIDTSFSDSRWVILEIALYSSNGTLLTGLAMASSACVTSGCWKSCVDASNYITAPNREVTR